MCRRIRKQNDSIANAKGVDLRCVRSIDPGSRFREMSRVDRIGLAIPSATPDALERLHVSSGRGA